MSTSVRRPPDLRRFPLLAHLTSVEAEQLSHRVHWQDFAARTILFQAGDTVSGVYLIDSGSVQLYRLSPHGQEQILAMPKAGDPLAEWAIFQGTSYPASALCISPCRLVFMERTVFESLVRSDGVLAMKLLAGISAKLQRALGLIEDLSLRDARARLCHYLSTHLGSSPHPGQEVALPVTQVVLARFLGIRGETLSRSLRQLRTDGILEPGGRRRRLVILDPLRLRQAAEGVRD